MPSFAGISFAPLSSLPSGGSLYDNEVFLTGSAAVTQVGSISMLLSLSLTAQGNVLAAVGEPKFNTLTVSASGTVNIAEGYLYQLTLTVAGNSALTPLIGNIIFATATVAGTSDADVAGDVFPGLALTISGSSAVALASNVAFFNSVTFGANANFFSPGGLAHFITRAIEGFSALTAVPGWSYFDTRTIAGNAATSQAEFYVINGTLTVAGSSAVTQTFLYSAGAFLTVAGFSAITLATNVNFYNTQPIPCVAHIFVDNFYENLYNVNALASIATTLAYLPNGLQNPNATGSVTVSATGVFNRVITQTLSLNQIITFKKPQQLVTQTYLPAQVIVKQKVPIRTVTQTLVFNQSQVAFRPVTNTLTLNQTIIHKKVITRTVTQTWSATQTVTTNNVISRTVAQTLVYNPTNVQRLPIIGANSNSPTHQFSYTVPNINVVLVPKKCVIILGVPRRTIILPCPIFGDSQAPQHEINLKRTMTGDTFTYVKKTKAQKLKYSFELWTNKYLELRQFYIDFSSEVMTLQNHHAETWLVNIVNNPLELAAEERSMHRGEKFTVALEFEGVKIV